MNNTFFVYRFCFIYFTIKL